MQQPHQQDVHSDCPCFPQDRIKGLGKDLNAKKRFREGVFAKDDAGIHGWEIGLRMGDMPPRQAGAY